MKFHDNGSVVLGGFSNRVGRVLSNSEDYADNDAHYTPFIKSV